MTQFNPNLGVLAVVTSALLLVLTIVETVASKRISSTTLHNAAFSGSLFLQMVFSPDMGKFYQWVGLGYNQYLCEIFGYFAFCCTMVAGVALLRSISLMEMSVASLLMFALCVVVCGVAYASLSAVGLQYLAHILLTAAVVAVVVAMDVKLFATNKDNVHTWLAVAIVFASMGMANTNLLYFTQSITFANGWSAAYMWIAMLCWVAVYVTFFVRLDNAALKASEYALQVERLRTRVLEEQIKPHFIFNSLTKVKSEYHKSVAAGDKALGLFSDYLRESISMIGQETVSFDVEMQNVANYIDFVNANRSKPFNVIFDIDIVEFDVPPFSLQPFVENALKYSRIDEKEDGLISIATFVEDNCVVVKISDNGVGFDADVTTDAPHGISNARERLRLLVGAQTTVQSKVGEGCVVTVRLPQKEEE